MKGNDLKTSIQTTLITLFTMVLSPFAVASSHREAPAISQDPAVDITDLYAFPTPQNNAAVTFVLNVYPASQPYAGPNWYQFAEDALYEIHIDNTGDGIEDMTYQFRFKNGAYKGSEGSVVANLPKIGFAEGRFTGCSLCQTYDVFKIPGLRRKGAPAKITTSPLLVAPPRIGPATTDGGAAGIPHSGSAEDRYSSYKDLATNANARVGSYQFFAGPRNDPFFADLGAIFDRLSVRLGLTGANAPRDSLAGANVLSIVFNVPISEFLAPGKTHFGVWGTTSRRQVKIRRPHGKDSKDGGPWVQVSRLGNPLLNELIIKMRDKDKFNASEPKDDGKNYLSYVLNPQLAGVLNGLYGPEGSTSAGFITKIDETDRTDMVAAFIDGVSGVNKHPDGVANAGDMLRVNLSYGTQEWPLSGRGLDNDVVKALLVFLAQCRVYAANSPMDNHPSSRPFGKVDEGVTANCIVDDGVLADDATLGRGSFIPRLNFPYLDLPSSGY